MDSLRSFRDDDADYDCLIKRFIHDMMLLPENNTQRIKIVMNDQQKQYYLDFYRSEL